MATVKIENLTKRFGKVTAVNKGSFEVRDKEFFCLLGPSGAGKTTTLRCIAGLETPEEGNVYLDGEIVNEIHPSQRDVAMFFQNLALYPHKSGYENIAFPLRQRKRPKQEIHERVMEVARVLQIDHILDREPWTFSGGERQRVALGRTIVRRPHVYLLDEPLSNLDALLRLNMRVELKRLQRDLGQTMIYVTPDQVEAMAMGDRICVINRGEIQQIDTPLNIYNHPVNKFVAEFIGSPPMNFIDCSYERTNGKATLKHDGFQIDVTPYKEKIEAESTGTDLLFCIRPEDVSIHEKPEGDNPVPATIYVIEPLGSKTVVDMEVADNVIKGIGPGFAQYNMGESKWVKFDMNRAHVIDKGTEKVIF